MAELELWDGSNWQQYATKNYANSLITPQLSALSSLSTTGIMIRTGANSFATRNLVGGAGVSILNETGINGNLKISINNNFVSESNYFTFNFITTPNPAVIDVLFSDTTNAYFLNRFGVSRSGYFYGFSQKVEKDNFNLLKYSFNCDLGTTSNNIFWIRESSSLLTFNNMILAGVVNPSSNDHAVNLGYLSSNYLQKGNISVTGITITGAGNFSGAHDISCYYLNVANNIDCTGDIRVQTGTLITNNIATYNSNQINVLNDIRLLNGINQTYIKQNSNYLTLRGVYTRGQKASCIIETNSYNETASIAMNGDYIQTIQTFDDLGFIFTDEDNDPQSSWQSYISSSGSLVTSSSKKKKHSIRKKEHKNYLERLNKLNIYSYALKTPILDNDNEKTKTRKYFKNKQLHLGLLSEEVEELFDNCTDNFKTIEFDKSNKKEIKESIKGYIPKVDEQEYIKVKNQKKGEIIGIKYDSLLCYTILAIQELSKKVESLEKGVN